MDMKDTLQLERWLRSKASLQEVLDANPVGLVGNVRFGPQARRAFVLAWNWSAHRFHGRIADRQDALYVKHGREFLERRIARCNRMIDRFLGRPSTTSEET